VTDLERFAALVLGQWQSEGGHPDGAIAIGALLDRIFPYRSARRMLAIEASEDYEALVLRLIAEEAKLVETRPPEAAEMARTTMASKIPDLDVLALLRSATITFTDDAVLRLEGVLPLTPPMPDEAEPLVEGKPARTDNMLAMRRQPETTGSPVAAPISRPSVEHRTGVAFIPPSSLCWQCDAPLPPGRDAKFCVECGADQRQPACSACGSGVERHWKHCPECGNRLTPGGSESMPS
jgi:hypothetical protein